MTGLRQYYRSLNVNLWLVGLALIGLALAGYSLLAGRIDSTARLAVIILSLPLLALMALFDFKLQIIPNHLLLINLVMTTFIIFWQSYSQNLPLLSLWLYYLAAGSACGLLFLLVKLLKSGLGAGDVKLFFVLGYSLGFDIGLSVIFYSGLLAVIYVLFMLLTKRIDFNKRLPLAPFALIGLIISLFLIFK